MDWFRSSKPSWISKIDKYPLVEAFKPYGLRVSISDVEGLEKFGFHGKLNQCFARGENGTIFGNVTKPTNGRLVYVNERVQLNVGDALHYWIYVKLNGEEHSFNKDVQIINNLIPKPQNLYELDTHPTIPTPHNVENNLNPNMCPCDQLNILSTFTSTSSMFPTFQPPAGAPAAAPVAQPTRQTAAPPAGPPAALPENFDPAGQPENFENIICKSQVDSLTEVLLVMLKDEILNPNLVLIGAEVTKNRSAIDEIVSLLTIMELFDLNGKIKFAYYLSCGIYFEMSSIVDKKRILSRAATDLKNSVYQFIEPEQAPCQYEKRTNPDIDIRMKK